MNKPLNIEIQIIEIQGEQLLDELMRQFQDENLLSDNPCALSGKREEMEKELNGKSVFRYRIADITTGIQKTGGTALVPTKRREAVYFDLLNQVRLLAQAAWTHADEIVGSKAVLAIVP
jgi:hypothetical protein